MSITFKTQSLITAAYQALKNYERDRAAWERKKTKFVADHRAAWVGEKRPQVIALRDALTKALKANAVVEYDSIADVASKIRSHGLSYICYSPPSPYEIGQEIGSRPGIPTGFQGLIELLKAHTGDTITANQLKLLGYTNLTGLFNAAVKAGGEAGK